MTSPQIVCPNCKTQIPVTDALAEPLVADARRHFEQQLAAKEADFGRREAQLRQAQDELSKARVAIDEQVAAKLKAERSLPSLRPKRRKLGSPWPTKSALGTSR